MNGIKEIEIQKLGKWVYDFIKAKLPEKQYKIFQPMPAPIDKIQNRIRYRMIIKGNMTKQTNEVLNDCLKQIYQKQIKDIRVMIDVNPNNMS